MRVGVVVLECTNLDFFYGKLQRLKSLNLRIDGGSLLGLFGSNGSGKSTLLHMLGGSLPVLFGEYRLFGMTAVDKSGYLRTDLRPNIGILFQGTSSDDKLSGSENLAFTAELMGIKKSERDGIIRECLERADLCERAHEQVKKFSGGMRRRLELYRTFMHKPKIVLLDEPTAGLDVAESQKFLSFVKNYIAETRAIVLMASHRPEELVLADNVLMMFRGESIGCSSPSELIARLNYLRCTFSFSTERAVCEFSSSFFDIEYDATRACVTAKLPVGDLETMLKSPLLRDGSIKAFTLEHPSVADAYADVVAAQVES